MKEFKFMGTKIFISSERDRYNKVRLKYKKLAQKGEQKFIKIYGEKNCNIDDVINKSYNQGISIISKVIEQTVKELIEMKFYSINKSVFIEKYCQDCILKWQEAYDLVSDKYMDIILDEQQKNEYRKQRKDNRARWQGGGFGLQGAIKGAAQAGAMNIATGAVHSAVNIVGNVGSSIKTNKEKSGLFHNKSTLKILSDGIYSSIWNIQYAYMEYLEKNSDLKFDYIYDNQSKEVEIILSNLKNRNIDIDERIDIFKTLIELDPYNRDIYTNLIKNFGDKNNEISKISNYFGIDITNYKINRINKKFKRLDTSTKAEVMKAKEIIQEEMCLLGIKQEINAIKEINNKLENFEKESRIVNNVLFDTEEEAEFAKIEIKKIECIIKDLNKESRESIIDSINKIKELDVETNLKSYYLNDLKNKIELLEVKERNKNEIYKQNKRKLKRYKIGLFVYIYFAVSGIFVSESFYDIVGWIIFMGLIGLINKNKFKQVLNSYKFGKKYVDIINDN